MNYCCFNTGFQFGIKSKQRVSVIFACFLFIHAFICKHKSKCLESKTIVKKNSNHIKLEHVGVLYSVRHNNYLQLC